MHHRPFDDFDLHEQSDEKKYEPEMEPDGDFEEDEKEDEDEELSEDETKVEFGEVCSICGEEFTEAHGKPTVCDDCAKRYKEQVVAEGLADQVHPLKKDA